MSTYYPPEPGKNTGNQPPNQPVDPYGNDPTVISSHPYGGPPSSPGNPPSQPYGAPPQQPYAPQQPSQPYGPIQGSPTPVPPPQYQQYPGYPPGPVSNPNLNPNTGPNSYAGYPNPVSYGGAPPNPVSYGGAPPTPTPRPRSNKALLIGIIVLVIVVSIGAVVVPYAKTQIDHSNATATVSTHQTSVARNATGTVTTQNAHATSTAQVFASATAAVVAANPNPYLPNQGTLVTVNKTPENSWLYSDNCILKENTFHAIIDQKETVFPCFGGYSYENFAYDINMTILQGDCGGILFRMDATEGHKYYMFNICRDGYYELDANTGAARKFTTLKYGNKAPGVNLGLNQPNLIGVVAQGPNLSFYVNKQHVMSITDSAYGKGQLGVTAWELESKTEVAFTNQRVWKL